MTPLQNALERSMEEGNIDLFLPEFLGTNFLVVCGFDPEQTDPPIFLTESPNESGLLCITVAESQNALADLDDIPHLVFKYLTGESLINLVRINHEIAVKFNDGQMYCISRDILEWWLENYFTDKA